ncbi:YbjQ family protein [Sphingobacterium puteale]|uniref:YbjQ family protein n=1 Tax=Sphingobacterium puteale TaxID=2420510 RepID=UPI003D9641C0
MIVTTTNSIEGREISRYNDPIAANVVIGTNIFIDIGASYVDFFGGRSTSYEKKMQEMYKRVTETLKQRAQAIRADAIIGLSVDIDEISGRGSQMFIIHSLGVRKKTNQMKTDVPFLWLSQEQKTELSLHLARLELTNLTEYNLRI